MSRYPTLRFFPYFMIIGILLQCLPITSVQAATISSSLLIQPVAVAPAINPRPAFLPPINSPYSGAISVTTRGYNTARTSANLNETVLSATNVMSNTFGKLFQRSVDGDIYAQPLYMPNINITYTRNVVYVATEHNSIYAFDADDPNASAPLWKVNLGTSAKNNFADYGLRYGTPYHDIQKEVGVTSTPVIEPGTGTMYVVNFECVLQSDPTTQCDPTNMITDTNQLGASHVYRHFIHALDIKTGAEKYGGPVMIQGFVPGVGGGSDGTNVNFDSKQQLQRPGLTLVNGNLYIAFSGFADTNPYHGWVMVYNLIGNPLTLQQTGIWNTTPNAGSSNTNDPEGEGGIWESGQGLTADSGGNLYVMTGNGTFDLNTNNNSDSKQKQYADSFIKLDTRHSDVVPIDWFTPNCQSWMKVVDADLGSGGPMVIPGPNPDPQNVGDLIIGAGKQGNIYVLKENSLGGYTPPASPANTQADCSDTGELSNIADRIDSGVGGGAYAAPVYWNSPTGKRIYYWGTSDKLKAYQMNSSTTFSHTAVATGTTSLSGGMPGGMLTLSANGSTSGTGIIWAMHVLTTSQSANATTRSGILRAYNAETLTQLWTSEMVSSRDSLNNGGGPNTSFLSKFNVPTVANGKVYVPTFAPGGGTTTGTYSTNLGGPAYLMVYGLLASKVTLTTDNGNGPINSLSYALTHSPPNQIISLAPSSGTVISVTGATLPNVPTGVTLKGSCSASGPGITIKYTGSTPNIDGLTLTSKIWLYGIKVQLFTGVQIKIPGGGGNVSNCVQASKT